VATHIAAIAIEQQTSREKLARTQAELAHAVQVTSMRELASSIGQDLTRRSERSLVTRTIVLSRSMK